MASIRLENITRRFGKEVAVEGVNLEIHDKEFLVLVGPSGCGKTTILRMISGLERPSEGRIFINDRLVNHIPPKDRDVAMVFQNYALYPHMTVYGNMAFGLETRGLPRKEIDRRVNQVAKKLVIDKLLRRKPGELSGGEKQRVALGRAIVRDPLVFLMDEPMSNLDAQLRSQTRTELIKLHRQLQKTTVYVTHDQIEAMTMGQRIVVMKAGVILQTGSPREIYDHPVSIFVAGFIGSPPMNFLEARIDRNNDGAVMIIEDKAIPVPASLMEKTSGNIKSKVIIGVRAENISLITETVPLKVQIPVKTDTVETIGADVHATVTAVTQSLVVRTAAHDCPAVNERYLATIDPRRMYLFNPETGESL
ncbi:MAG: ABC transporter ATP-binding protein [Dehalococcoidales bacterium]|nr:ABC transporter ATP-binding protein [Dehalococcoidales bacterium]